MISVLVVDNYPVVREGACSILGQDAGLDVVGVAGSGKEAIEFLTGRMVDLIVMDVRLPDGDGIEFAEDLRGKHPDVRILIFSQFGNDRTMMRAFRAGVHGFLVKDTDSVVLRQAARTVATGGVFVDPKLADNLVHTATQKCKPRRPFGLSPQELKVVGLLPKGLTNQQIGAELGVSMETVKSHLHNAMRKLEVEDRASVAAIAVREGIS